MIKVAASAARTIRECTAKYEYNLDNELKTENIIVRYFSPTISELKETKLEIEKKFDKNPDEVFWLSENLAKRLHSLPDLVDEKGKSLKITVAFLETLDLKNLEAIKNAVEQDLRPKSESTT